MDHVAPVGSVDPADWKDGDRAAGIKGSRVPHRAMTDGNTEIVNAIIKGGLVPDPEDLTQLSTVMFPGPDDPPVAPNLPHLVVDINELQGFNSGVQTAIQWAVTIKNNFPNSTWDGTTLTIGAGDAGLYDMLLSCQITAIGATELILYMKVNNVITHTLGDPGGVSGFRREQLAARQRLAVGDTLHFEIQLAMAANGLPLDKDVTHLFVTKESE